MSNHDWNKIQQIYADEPCKSDKEFCIKHNIPYLSFRKRKRTFVQHICNKTLSKKINEKIEKKAEASAEIIAERLEKIRLNIIDAAEVASAKIKEKFESCRTEPKEFNYLSDSLLKINTVRKELIDKNTETGKEELNDMPINKIETFVTEQTTENESIKESTQISV